ncbi:MAG TPA: potassium-transporting ATPase subunit C, partial [Caldimonas sp.]|nr:potassium-transporting ATPase subunit C [Caldimonas sp.]
MWKELKPAVLLFVVLSVITGVAYPLVVTGIAQAA